MNKKRMTLTVVALIAFGAIIALHYLPSGDYRYPLRGVHMIGGPPPPTPVMWIGDVRMPLFVLAVFYAGLFFFFGGKDAEPVPHRPINWRRIKVIGMVLAGLVVIVGLTAAIIYAHKQEATRQANLEYLKRIEATHKAYNEYEASKHRITESEIDLIDLQLGHRHWDNLYHLTGRIRNRAANNCTLILSNY